MACCNSFMKYGVYIVNLLLALAGVALLAFGAYALLKTGSVEYNYFWAWMLIGIGFIVILVAILGSCGTAKKSRWMTAMYSIILVGLIVVEVGGAVYAYFYPENFVQKTCEGVQELSNKKCPESFTEIEYVKPGSFAVLGCCIFELLAVFFSLGVAHSKKNEEEEEGSSSAPENTA